MRVKFMLLKVSGKLAAMKTTFQFPLLDLPNEIIAEVIEHVDSRTTLRKLSTTCRRIQELTEPVLYRYALVRSRVQARALLHSMRKRSSRGSARAKALRELDVPCNWRQEQSFDDLARLVAGAANLKQLMLEGPECNHGEFEEPEHYEQMMAALLRPFERAIADHGEKPLQKLQELVLHLNGPESPYWDIDHRTICLFSLPSLQRLKLSCVNIGDDVAEGITRKSFTCLKHLVIEEANVTHRGLHGILALPRSLETLYLGENCHNLAHFDEAIDPAANYLWRNNPEAVIDAIGQQKSSLKELTYVTPEPDGRGCKLPERSAVDAGLADFACLESVTLQGMSRNFERAVLSSRAPPMLKNLTWKTGYMLWHADTKVIAENVASFIPFIRAPSSCIPKSLKKLRIVCDGQNPDDWGVRVNLETTANMLAKRGLLLEAAFESRTPYFPPYLYGEPLPAVTTVFDGVWLGATQESLGIPWAAVED